MVTGNLTLEARQPNTKRNGTVKPFNNEDDAFTPVANTISCPVEAATIHVAMPTVTNHKMFLLFM